MRPVPDQIVIPHDDHHGRYVGRSGGGAQFFITINVVSDLEYEVACGDSQSAWHGLSPHNDWRERKCFARIHCFNFH